jgi:hypothetical protein
LVHYRVRPACHPYCHGRRYRDGDRGEAPIAGFRTNYPKGRFERPADPTAYCNAQKRRSLIVGLNHFEAMAPKPETSSFLEQYFSLARAVFD